MGCACPKRWTSCTRPRSRRDGRRWPWGATTSTASRPAGWPAAGTTSGRSARRSCPPGAAAGWTNRAGRTSALDSHELAGRFRAALLQTIRETRPHARGERPLPAQGLAVGDVIGEESERTLRGEATAQQALDRAQQRILALGDLDVHP